MPAFKYKPTATFQSTTEQWSGNTKPVGQTTHTYIISLFVECSHWKSSAQECKWTIGLVWCCTTSLIGGGTA